MKLTSLLQLVDKSQEAGENGNLQQICGVFRHVYKFQSGFYLNNFEYISTSILTNSFDRKIGVEKTLM